MSDNGKPKLAMYWASSCGGCEIAVLNIGEHLLVVDEVFDLAFFPCLADFKVSDLKSYPAGYIDVCLFNGAIRTSENEEMAQLLREKSKIMVAFGSCAYEGCIPALSNLTTREDTLHTVYLDNPSLDNPAGVVPQPLTTMAEGTLSIPVFYHTVKSLDQVVNVDYTIPGCPPEPHQIWTVLQAVVAALLQGAALPPAGSIIGAGNVAVCEECPLERNVKHIDRFYRPYHARAIAVLQARRARGPVLLVGIHSFTPSLRGEARPMDFGVLCTDDGARAAALCQALAADGWRAQVNAPYSGHDGFMHAGDTHAAAAGDVPVLMIEIRQDHLREGAGVARMAQALARALPAVAP